MLAEPSYIKRIYEEMAITTIPERFSYTTQVLAEARGVDFTAFSKRVQFKYPQVPIIQASVAAGPPVAGALVTGVITRPDGTKVDIKLYDDGDFSHGDVRADDGIYSNRFLDFAKDGSYKIHLTVNNIEGVEATPDEPVPTDWKPKPIPPFNRVSKSTIIMRGLPAIFPTLKIESITPSEGKQGETLNTTITGSNFVESAVISLLGDGVSIRKAAFVSPEKLTANITIDPRAAPGTRDVKITNPGGQSDTAEGIFSVKKEVKPWSVSFHTGTAMPTGNFANSYDSGFNIIVDLDYHFTPQIAVVGLFGYNNFKDKANGDFYWLNLSGNARYYFTGARYNYFLGAGPGIYIPERGSSKLGLNLGGGIDFPINPRFSAEVGVDYHITFDGDTTFVHFHVGLVF